MKKLLGMAILITAAAGVLAAADTTLAVSFGPVRELLQARCAACHDWPGSLEGILGVVAPGDPGASLMWKKVSMDLMPPDEPLADAEKTLLRDWIAAGAPTDASAADVSAADANATDATTGATTAEDEVPAAPSTFLGFKSKTAFHMASGYTSSALFLGAAVVGAVQWGTLMSESHAYRDSLGIDDEPNALCRVYIANLRDDQLHRSLRWIHVGLLSAGEALYLADAITGLSMLSKDRPGLTPQDIHRYAFFLHGSLMIGELVLGILSSTFLDLGDHWSIVGVGIAHTAIGVTIPAVMLGAGLYINSVFR